MPKNCIFCFLYVETNVFSVSCWFWSTWFTGTAPKKGCGYLVENLGISCYNNLDIVNNQGKDNDPEDRQTKKGRKMGIKTAHKIS